MDSLAQCSLVCLSLSDSQLDSFWLEDEEVSGSNSSSVMTEDTVWTSMVRLAWQDYIARINRDKADWTTPGVPDPGEKTFLDVNLVIMILTQSKAPKTSC